jgi:HlyD family secretion protein
MIDLNPSPSPKLLLLALLCVAAGCGRPASRAVQGYVEGEFVYVSSPLAGALDTLAVQRGARVRAGDPLFSLADTPEKAARDQAAEQLAQARAALDDAQKGKRPTEIASLQAQLEEAQAALTLAGQELARQEKLAATPGGGAAQDLDRARSTQAQESRHLAQLEADLQTARLGSREDQIAAAAASVRALQAALVRAEWDLSQKRQSAPQASLVFDTIYRQGEWVAAGRPVVALLPPENVKVRAFVSETTVGAIHAGDPVRVTVDGASGALAGKVSFISPQAEYTPPVIYSQESRGKLVFMVEAVFEPAVAANLHPGQPVDVQFGP